MAQGNQKVEELPPGDLDGREKMRGEGSKPPNGFAVLVDDIRLYLWRIAHGSPAPMNFGGRLVKTASNYNGDGPGAGEQPHKFAMNQSPINLVFISAPG